MNVAGLLHWFDPLPAYQELVKDLQAGCSPGPLGLPRAARPAVLAALARDLPRPILLVTGSAEQARTLHQSLCHWRPQGTPTLRLPEPPTLFYEQAPWPREIVGERIGVLCRLAAAAPDPDLLIVASTRALMQPTLPLKEFRAQSLVLQPGQALDLAEALHRWSGLGYEPVSVVEGPGQFSHRGGILDIFSPAELFPVRVELFGDQVESIRLFDPATQRSDTYLEQATIPPAREPLPCHSPRVLQKLAPWLDQDHPPEVAAKLSLHREALAAGAPFAGLEFYLPYYYEQPVTLANYLPAHGLLVLNDPADLQETWAEFEQEALDLKERSEKERHLPPDYPLPYVTWDDWQEDMADRAPLILGHGEEESSQELGTLFRDGPRYGGQLGSLMNEIEKSLQTRDQVVVASRQARRLAELWAEEREHVLPITELSQAPKNPLTFVQGPLEEGWMLQGTDSAGFPRRFYLHTDAEIFGWRMPEPRRPLRRRRPAPESLYADLKPGDIVVHIDYGIGIFCGLTTLITDNETREYLLVEYADHDQLYVPVYQADRLSRYVGADDRLPKLHRLGSATWGQVKSRARKAVEAIAKELLELYAIREITPGHAFSPDTPWQAELEASFPYSETPDQAQAIAEVKADMERSHPMDRLVCGDVGYGKTEVALRAAFKAVMGGKQVAILVPTTVLAQQHYTTFRHRLAPFPINVEMLSRFRTRAEQRLALEGLLSGAVDIVIGTHRLLQQDVAFQDLGLVVIDEEQRFGVTHKEKLKKIRTEVDVLTMTATPIPRTLYFSLTGVRDISVIETPPEERLPVSTYVGPYDPEVMRRAILREMERSGQVFYVHNRVQTIEAARHRLVQQVPEAVVAVAHGQMRERELERVMLQFVSGQVDVLLCTSIIESGLDIPNANTLVVEQAERFGLAQLYQLRGRVGRGARRAHAYFFYRPGRLTAESRYRLDTIREASELGAGYTIAMRDLELRGAGDVLGTRQSGHIAVVGFDLYTRLLARAVEELRARRQDRPPPPTPLSNIHIDLPIPSGLPPEYVPDDDLRLRLYRRLANLGNLEQIEGMKSELVDRFGPLPGPAENLMRQLRLKVLAREVRVTRILVEGENLVLHVERMNRGERQQLQKRLGELAHVGYQNVTLAMDGDWLSRLSTALERMND
ncbi:MAG: transcription-repair coupling factor [Anaerolineae bacterium]|nr:transcription-repair coupling factor [Anaerolineae bacterium]